MIDESIDLILTDIYQEVESSRTRTIVVVVLKINGKQFDYTYESYGLEFIEALLCSKLDGAIATIDRQTMNLITVKNKLESDLDSKAIYFNLDIGYGMNRSFWLINGTESHFIESVNQAISQHFSTN